MASDHSPLAPLALTAKQTGELLGVDAATVRRNSAAGTMPAPVKVSAAAVRWNRREIEDWLDAKCPGASAWHWPAVTELTMPADGGDE